MTLLRILCLLLTLANFGQGKVVRKHEVIYDKAFVPIAKFCFITQGGHIRVNFEQLDLTSDALATFAMYSDRDWPNIQERTLTCEEKLNRTRYRYAFDEAGKLKHTWSVSGQRRHFWYVVLAQCTDEHVRMRGIDVEMTNESIWLAHQFSADLLWIFLQLILLAGFTSLYLLVLMLFMRRQQFLPYSEFPRKLYEVLRNIASFEMLAYLLELVHYSVYAQNGIGIPALAHISASMHALTRVGVAALLLYLARGWIVSSNEVPSRFLWSMCTLLGCAYVTLFVWSLVYRDPISVVYIFESPIGVVILVLNGLLCAWFLQSLWITYYAETHSTSRRFYCRLAFCGTAWFLMPPLTVMIAHFVDAWVRAGIVHMIESMTTIVLFVWLTLVFGPLLNTHNGVYLLPNPDLEEGSGAVSGTANDAPFCCGGSRVLQRREEFGRHKRVFLQELPQFVDAAS